VDPLEDQRLAERLEDQLLAVLAEQLEDQCLVDPLEDQRLAEKLEDQLPVELWPVEQMARWGDPVQGVFSVGILSTLTLSTLP
jgi:hypothetical protein